MDKGYCYYNCRKSIEIFLREKFYVDNIKF